MYIPKYYLYFIKVLPNYSKISFASYLEKLLNTIECNWDIDVVLITERPEKESEFYVKFNTTYIKQRFTNLYVESMSSSFITPPPPITYTFWRRYIKGIGNTRLTVRFFIEKYICFECDLDPLPTERKKYEDLFFQEIERGVADYLAIGTGSELYKETKYGKPQWLYLHEKLEFLSLKDLNHHHQKMLPESRNLVYELACKIESLLSFLGILEIERVTAEMKECMNIKTPILDSSEYKELLCKYDNILLDNWGKEAFSNNLAPLGISLERWLQAR